MEQQKQQRQQRQQQRLLQQHLWSSGGGAEGSFPPKEKRILVLTLCAGTVYFGTHCGPFSRALSGHMVLLFASTVWSLSPLAWTRASWISLGTVLLLGQFSKHLRPTL